MKQNEEVLEDTFEVETEDGVRFLQMSADVQLDRILSPTDKAVYATLCCYVYGAFRESRTCFPATSQIAFYTNCSERTVYRSIEALENRGALKVVRTRQKNGRQGHNRYILINKLPSIQTDKNDGLENQTDNLSKPDCQKRQYESITKELENNTLPTVEATDVADAQKAINSECRGLGLSLKPETVMMSVPAVMKEAVTHLLSVTGREGGLVAEEIRPLKELARLHTPLRVIKEIDVAAARFELKGRPQASLTFEYIWESLKHQPSTLRTAFKPRKDKPPTAGKHGLSEAEQKYQEAIMAKWGGGGDGDVGAKQNIGNP